MTRINFFRINVFCVVIFSWLLGSCSVVSPTLIPAINSTGIALNGSEDISSGVSIGFINDDEYPDIVFSKGRHWKLINKVYFGTSDYGYRVAKKIGGIPDKSYSTTLFDIDGDLDLDLLIGNDKGDPNYIYFNNGNGTYSSSQEFGAAKWPTRSLMVEYVDNDPYPDVVVSNRTRKGKSVYICYGQKKGNVENKCKWLSKVSSTSALAVDINKDDLLDIVVPSRNGRQSFIFPGLGNRKFGEKITLAHSDASIRNICVEDLNGDDLLDIALIDQKKGVGIVWGGGDYNFSETKWIEKSEARPNALGCADLNGDSQKEIIVGYAKSNSKAFFKLSSASQEYKSVSFGDNNGVVYGFAFADLNNDNFLDVVVARSGASDLVFYSRINIKN